MNMTIKKWVILGLTFGVILYLAIYLWGSYSESFAFVQRYLMSSPEISSKVGRVERVSLDPFGGYSESFVDDSRTAKMSVNITGSKADAAVDVVVTKNNGTWQLRQINMGGEKINSDKR